VNVPKWVWYVVAVVVAYMLYTRYVAVKISAQSAKQK